LLKIINVFGIRNKKCSKGSYFSYLTGNQLNT
jgi:hypothetical protein